MGLGLLLSAPSHPRCLLPWAGCRQAALSRPPSRVLHFSVWRETVAIINLAGALRAGDTARLAQAAGGHWCPWPLAHLSPSTRPIPSASGAAQHPPGSLAAPRTEPVLPEMSPSPRLGVWCWAPACRGVSQGFCFCLAEAVLLCFVCSQSVSFVSVFEKKIRSLPPPPPTRYQPGVTTAIVSLSDPDTRENSQSGTSGEPWFPSLFSFQGHLCCGEVGQGIEPFPASQLASQFGGGGERSPGDAGVRGAGMLGRSGGISSAGGGGWGRRCLVCRDLIRAELCS